MKQPIGGAIHIILENYKWVASVLFITLIDETKMLALWATLDENVLSEIVYKLVNYGIVSLKARIGLKNGISYQKNLWLFSNTIFSNPSLQIQFWENVISELIWNVHDFAVFLNKNQVPRVLYSLFRTKFKPKI